MYEFLEFVVVGTGAFIGACLRFTLIKIVSHLPGSIPFATLLSNVIAGFLIGFIIGLEQHSVTLTPRTKLFITTGFMGGLSTFSTFSLETVNMFSSGRFILAFGNILLNLGLSLTGVVLGMFLAKSIL